MTTTVQKIKLSLSCDIPFNKLISSQSNVRRVKVDATGSTVLAKVLERYPVVRVAERAAA